MIDTLDLEVINSFLNTTNRNLIFLYSLVLLVSIGKFKVVNSLTLCTITAMAFHGMNIAIFDILKPYNDALVSDSSNAENIIKANYIWYSVWGGFYLVATYSVHFIHNRINLNDTQVSKMLSGSYFAMLGLQAIGYFDAFYFYSDTLALIYHFGMPAINISLGFYFLFKLRDRREVYDDIDWVADD